MADGPLNCAECGREPREDENAQDEWRAYRDISDPFAGGWTSEHDRLVQAATKAFEQAGTGTSPKSRRSGIPPTGGRSAG